MFKNTSDFKSDRITMCVYGESGSGKTTLIKTLPGKVCVVNAENGLLSIAGESIDVYDITVGKDGTTLPMNQRYMKLMHALDNVFPDTDYDWLVFDSLSEISQCLYEHLVKKHPNMGIPFWTDLSKETSGLVRRLRDYKPFNILMLALDTGVELESGRKVLSVDVNGKSGIKVPALIDELFYLKVYLEDGKEVRKLFTSNHNNIIAKDRSDKLDKMEDPDLTMIINKIKGE